MKIIIECKNLECAMKFYDSVIENVKDVSAIVVVDSAGKMEGDDGHYVKMEPDHG